MIYVLQVIGVVVAGTIATVGIAVLIATVVVPLLFGVGLLVHARVTKYQRCPACGAKELRKIQQAEIPDQVWTIGCRGHHVILEQHRCRRCATEFCREKAEQHGPFIWKAAWDEGTRVALPQARLR